MRRTVRVILRTLLAAACLFILVHVVVYIVYTPTCDGLDVSHHNRSIEAPGQQISFIIAKATEGDNYVDPDYARYRTYARERGLKFGAYHFMSTRTSAAEQFDNYRNTVGRDIDIIPVLDVESHKGMKRLSRSEMRAFVKEWSDLCRGYYGRAPIIYCNNMYRLYYFMDMDNPMWIDSKTAHPWLPCAIHQYTNNGDTLDYNHLLTDLTNLCL